MGLSWNSIWGRVLLSPSAHPISCEKRELRIAHQAGVVQLWEQRAEGCNEKPTLVVLRLLGARGRAELATLDPVNRLEIKSCAVCTLNPPAFGATQGPLTIESYLRSTLVAFDALKSNYPNAQIWIYGKSIGATAAMYLASQRSPDAAVFKNIIDVPFAVLHRSPRWMPARARLAIQNQVPENLAPVILAPKAKSRALFVISSGDELSPPNVQAQILRSYGGSATRLDIRGGHDEPALYPEDENAYKVAIVGLLSA